MRLLITAFIFLAVSIPAQAAHRHHHRHHQHYAQHHAGHRAHHRVAAHARRHREARQAHRQRRHESAHAGGGMVTVATLAGPITVASHLADRFKDLIADFVAHGYKPRHIGCLAHGGHVPHSRHYAGAACDFDQRGWGMTVPFMYHAHAIIVKHGFRDGCSFNDCGHVDDGKSVHYAQRNYDDFGG